MLFRLTSIVASATPSSSSVLFDSVRAPVFVLEGICVLEVLRIVVGDLPGNLVLGVVLHLIRFTALTQVFPHNHWTVPVVLITWCLTEITRYPMYIFPSSTLCRSIRMVVPLVTFPIGCATEAYGAYCVLFEAHTVLWVKAALVIMLFVNGVLGPTMAYPALLKKGLPVLGLAKKKEKIIKMV